ncbi:MAG TPA: pantoate--beta-alanine ligase [Acidimicrobiia bacterium]|nr:pantoate--beta-alanine ligase [Acidimicrobiia bacterium]
MIVVERIAELRDRCDSARRAGQTVGLVPTMGFFHEGHLSLMRAARANHDLVVTTIFVNPLQFGETEDLAGYPRDLAADTVAAEAEGVDVLFVPSVPEMYPEPAVTTVHVAGLTEGLCGAARPTHFDGVTTVVAKLFSIVGPSTAYFGRKDFQQLAVVRRMAADLDLPVQVVGCPLVREPDGVAMSSRNAYLSADERRRATGVFTSLRAAAAAVEAGERAPEHVRAAVEAEAARHGLELEYAEVRRASDLAPLTSVDGEVVVAVATAVGKARLIDNVTMQIAGAEVSTDLGVITLAEQESTS